MKDFFAEYRKNTVKKHVSIALSALVLAIGVNAFLFGTPVGTKIQTSALQYATSSSTSTGSDIFLVSAGTGTDLIKLKTNKALSGVKEIRGTILFDAKGIKVRDIFTTNNNANITKISNMDGIMLVNIRYTNPENIAPGAEIATIAATKTGTGRAVVNLAETQFVSTTGTYELTNEAVEF